MKYVRQFLIILLISFLGEALYEVLPLPIPASVYGLVLMLTALGTGILKVSQVREASALLIEAMPVMFIPAGVGLMTSWNTLKPVFFPVIVITVLTTVIVMVITGRVTQAVIKRDRKEQNHD